MRISYLAVGDRQVARARYGDISRTPQSRLTHNHSVRVGDGSSPVRQRRIPDKNRLAVEVDHGQPSVSGRTVPGGKLQQTAHFAPSAAERRGGRGRRRGDAAAVGPVSSRKETQSTCLVVGDDDVVAGRDVADAAWSTNHIAADNTNQLPAVLQNSACLSALNKFISRK